jgi:hypothetical protein
MRRFRIGSLAELHARSIKEPSWFWAAVVEDLGIDFFRSWAQVADLSGSPAALPKTRSAKVLRRVVQAVAGRRDPGDLSSHEDPASVDAIRAA